MYVFLSRVSCCIVWWKSWDDPAAQDFLYLTFSDDEDMPPARFQRRIVAGISLHVGGKFLFPEFAMLLACFFHS